VRLVRICIVMKDDMKEIIKAGIWILLTVVVISAYQDLSETSDRNIIRKMVYKCEKDLPRNQQCYIIAVPPSKD